MKKFMIDYTYYSKYSNTPFAALLLDRIQSYSFYRNIANNNNNTVVNVYILVKSIAIAPNAATNIPFFITAALLSFVPHGSAPG